MFSFHEVLFSICKLQKCLMFLQYKILNSTSNCIGKLSLKNDRLTRDFLLAAIYIFDYLKDHNNYDEAQRVLDDLLSCSGSLCPSEYDIKNTCDCGEIVQ